MAPDAPEISPQQLTAIIQNIDIDAVPDAALVEIVASDAFEQVSEEVIVEVIEAIEYDELTEDQTEQLVTALNETSDDVKSVFEDTVNVYSGQFDTYVPSGSIVSVGTRRVVVAVAAATIAAAAPAPSTRRK